MNRIGLIFCIGIIFVLQQIAMSEVILRRDGLPDIHGEILSGSETGLLIKTDGSPGQSSRIPWSTIESIEPTQPRPRLQKFMEEGKQLWRAKQRLLRGDVQLSEPIFANQFRRLIGTNGVDSRIAAEGLLRVYVSRGALSKGLHPWLETVRLEENGIASPYPDFQPILDEKTMLCPHLPIFGIEQSAQQYIENYTSKDSSKASSIAKILMSKDESIHGLQNAIAQNQLFLSQIISAKNGDLKAVNDLEESFADLKTWQVGWAHYSIALGMLHNHGKLKRHSGLLHLAYVCSMDSSIQPWLTGAAMLRLSEELEKDGFTQQSKRIRQEVIHLFPTHPLLQTMNETKRTYTQ